MVSGISGGALPGEASGDGPPGPAGGSGHGYHLPGQAGSLSLADDTLVVLPMVSLISLY